MSAFNGKVLSSWSLLCLTSLYLLQVSFMEDVGDTSIEKIKDTRRPIWNIAHMMNDKDQINQHIDQGANGIEFDVDFNNEGLAYRTKHMCPADYDSHCAGTTEIVEYIKYVREITSPDSKLYRKKLVLLIMDFKLGKDESHWKPAGKDFAEKLLTHYWQKGKTGAKAYIILCVPSYQKMDFITGFREKLNESDHCEYYDKRIGYDFSENEDLDEIQSAFEKEGIDKNIWQSDGYTNLVLPHLPVTRLLECLHRRDNTESYFNKVYWWTVDEPDLIKDGLWWGVDGLLSNLPDVVTKVFNEDIEIKRLFRFATLDDNPWEKYTFNVTN